MAVNARDRRIELDKRIPLVGRVKEWMEQVCSRCEHGLAVPTNGSKSHVFCKEGRVEKFAWWCRPITTEAKILKIEKVTPWSELSSSYLKRVMRMRWRPFKMKNLLQIIADESRDG